VSAKAYRRDRSESMLAMSIGFAVIVVGSVIEEVFLELLHYQLVEAHTLEKVTACLCSSKAGELSSSSYHIPIQLLKSHVS
jgi:hypothetical protein